MKDIKIRLVDMNLFRNVRYPLAIVALYVTLRITYSFFYIELDAEVFGWGSYCISHLRTVADTVLLAIPIWIFGGRFRWWGYVWFLLIDILLLSSVWYGRNFDTVIHYTDFFMTDNLDGLLPSVLASMKMTDICIIFPFLVFMVLDSFLFNRKQTVIFCKRTIVYIAIIIIALLVELQAGWHNYIGTGGNRTLMMIHYGVLHVFRYDCLNHNKECTPEQRKAIQHFLDKKENERRQVDSLFEKHQKNLIVILVESLASWPIGLVYDEKEVTPNLNKIISENFAFYLPNVLPQTRDSRSADAQLMLNTGLLPILSGAAACMYSSNEYPSLPKALEQKGYKSYSFICDASSYWCQGANSRAFGFSHLYDKVELSDQKQNLTDKELFTYVFPILTTLPTPFYAQLVTLSLHCPYNASNCPDKKSSFLPGIHPDSEVNYYLAAVHYVDEQIGYFMKCLKETPLYENSIILITGDHEDLTYNRFKGSVEVGIADTYIPLIMIHSPVAVEDTTHVIGQSDIYPSLLYVMGASDYYWSGVGQNFFLQQDDCAISRQGKVAGRNLKFELIEQKQQAWQVSDWIIRSDFFKEK